MKLLLLAALCLLAASHAAALGPGSVCDRMTTAFSGNASDAGQESAMMKAYVTRLMDSPSGFVATNSPLLDIFSMQDAPYRANPIPVNRANVIINMGLFFGLGLNCNAPGYPTPAMVGSVLNPMRAMMIPITATDMNYFVLLASSTLMSFNGATQDDVNNFLVPFLSYFNLCGADAICSDVSCDLATNAIVVCVENHLMTRVLNAIASSSSVIELSAAERSRIAGIVVSTVLITAVLTVSAVALIIRFYASGHPLWMGFVKLPQK
jgi:hypothetical protein